MSTMNERAWAPPYPDGIGADNIRPIAEWRRHASPVGIAVFALVVVLALTGLLGRERTWAAEAAGTRLQVEAPEIIRNGEFFEMRFRVATTEPIEELVIGIGAELWTDMTVNTMIPAATEEQVTDDEFRFTFGPLEPDTEFLFKVDLQVNPDIVLGNRAHVTVYDGESELVGTDLTIAVLP